MDLRSTTRPPGGGGCAPGETTRETTISEDGDYTLSSFMDLRLCGSIEALRSRDHEECVAGEAKERRRPYKLLVVLTSRYRELQLQWLFLMYGRGDLSYILYPSAIVHLERKNKIVCEHYGLVMGQEGMSGVPRSKIGKINIYAHRKSGPREH